MKAFIWLLLVSYRFGRYECGTLPASQAAEQTLIATLLTGYNKYIRPASVVFVDITATLQQIVAIDEKQQIMTSSSFISQTWADDRLSWTPNASTNISVVMLPVKSLWIPDTMILNSADASGYLTISDYSLASVDNTGQVYMTLPALAIRTRCTLFVQKFPFDRQICNINLTSWSEGSNRIVYTENVSSVIDIHGYSEHPLWKLQKVDLIATSDADRTPFEDADNRVISIQLNLQRKPLYFIINGIFACLILNCVTLLAYSLPFGSQTSLCMVCFMTYSVYSLSFSSLFPQQSEYLMLITLFFLLSICWTLISMAWFVLCNHYISNTEMPKALDTFSELLKRAFCCCFPPKDDGKKSDATTASGNEQATGTPRRTCASCQELFLWCPRRGRKVEDADKQDNGTSEEAKGAAGTKSSTCDGTAELAKSKCDFCNRCESCQADFDKDKAKDKKKKEIEAKCSALNYFVFIWVFLFMFISNMVLWLTMSG